MSLVLATILVKVVGTVFCNYHLADISSTKQQTNKQTNKQKTYTHKKTILARKYAPERESAARLRNLAVFIQNINIDWGEGKN